MKTTFTPFLIVCCLSFQTSAERSSDRASRWGSGKTDSPSTRSAAPAPVRSAPAPRYAAPATPSRTTYAAPATPSRTYAAPAPQPAPQRTYTPPASQPPSRSFEAPQRTYAAPAPQPAPQRTPTPSNSYRSEPSPTRTAPVQTPNVTRTAERTVNAVSSRERFERETRTIPAPAYQTQPVAKKAPSTSRNVHSVQERTPQAAVSRNRWDREQPQVADKNPLPAPTPTTPQRVSPASRETYLPRGEQPKTVQLTKPWSDRRLTEKRSSPFIFEERSPSTREPTERNSRTALSTAQQQAVSLRSPRTTDSRIRESEHDWRSPSSQRSARHPPAYPNSHYSSYKHHYPTYSHHRYRPVTCYNSREAFWTAFGFTLGMSLFAPVYMGPTYYSGASYVTTWNGGYASFSIATPVFRTYRPYYCNTGAIHDGWHYSSAYYGGWRCNWYGGFSYIFNPYPVYRTYYLYEEPQTIVIQQPAQQVVYVNQPAQQSAPAVPEQQFVPPAEPLAEQPLATEPETRCFCACRCNGRVPCICEYACGSEFAYSPEDYSVKGFASYAESLNAELIWSSYAGLDRVAPEVFVAGAQD